MLGKMISLGRPQLVPILAFNLLIFVWALRWQMSSLSYGYSWVKGKENGMATGDGPQQIPTTLTSPQAYGLGHPLATDIDLSDPDAPFVGWPLKRVCNEVDVWTEGVTFMCDNNFGGVGNVRNFILTCVRYAIEAGATGLVMPAIRKRKDDNIKIIFDKSEFRPFGYLFDEENFRLAMGENCPQMTLYDDWTKVPHIRYMNDSSEPEIQNIDPRQMGLDVGNPDRNPVIEPCDTAELDHHSDRFGVGFRRWVADPQNGIPPSKTNTRLFRGNDWPGVLWQWPVYRDGPEFANTFAGLTKFNKTIMQLGKKTLDNMYAFARQHNRARGIKRPDGDESTFFGAHLRSEADAESFWPTYDEQEEVYLEKAEDNGLTVGYVASGDLNEAHKLAKAALEQSAMVLLSKDDLLDDQELEQLHSMSWDQQGLIDYIVLAGAEYFAGNSRSSFSISMCLKRNLKMEGLYSRPYKLRPDGYGRNFVVGPMERYYEHWLFIWDAMWP